MSVLKWPWGTYIGYCCQEWIMPKMIKPGRCGKCGEVPKYLRDDDGK